jgi:hypothetical protein
MLMRQMHNSWGFSFFRQVLWKLAMLSCANLALSVNKMSEGKCDSIQLFQDSHQRQTFEPIGGSMDTIGFHVI